MKAVFAFLLAAWSGLAAAAFDANDVRLGANEKAVMQHFPSAHCQPLQWSSRAADRRCDDSRITLGGIDARVTFYLKNDALEAFDIRVDSRQLERFIEFLRTRFGEPFSETREKVTKLQWRDKGERAVLTSEPGKRVASLLVSRGDFDEEIYKVR